MHVKNHMPMWILWVLWILHVRHSLNWLYKPLCAFLVFVDLVWSALRFLVMCGSCVVGFAVLGNNWQGHKCPWQTWLWDL